MIVMGQTRSSETADQNILPLIPFDLIAALIVPTELVVAITADVLQHCMSIFDMFSSNSGWFLLPTKMTV